MLGSSSVIWVVGCEGGKNAVDIILRSTLLCAVNGLLGSSRIVRVVGCESSEDGSNVILTTELDIHNGSSGLGILGVVLTESLEDASNIILRGTRDCIMLDVLISLYIYSRSLPDEAKTMLENAATVRKDV